MHVFVASFPKAFWASMAKTLASRTAVENADKAVQSESSLTFDFRDIALTLISLVWW